MVSGQKRLVVNLFCKNIRSRAKKKAAVVFWASVKSTREGEGERGDPEESVCY
jgi:hypothetical protein